MHTEGWKETAPWKRKFRFSVKVNIYLKLCICLKSENVNIENEDATGKKILNFLNLAFQNEKMDEEWTDLPLPCKTFTIEFFAKIVNGWKPLIIFAKSSLLETWLGSEYTSVNFDNYKLAIFKLAIFASLQLTRFLLNIYYLIKNYSLGNLKSTWAKKVPKEHSLREKCPNTKFFLVRIPENTDQKKLRISTLFTQWL